MKDIRPAVSIQTLPVIPDTEEAEDLAAIVHELLEFVIIQDVCGFAEHSLDILLDIVVRRPSRLLRLTVNIIWVIGVSYSDNNRPT